MKIRKLRARDLPQVLDLLERFGEEPSQSGMLRRYGGAFLVSQDLSQLLPPQYQFLPAIYVAMSEEDVLGFIWLSQDGYRTDRWRIEQIIIDPAADNPLEVGAHLVHFIINRYGAEGVQTFLALVDARYEQALSLLKGCGFRHSTRLHSYVLTESEPESLRALAQETFPPGCFFREAGRGDRQALQSLYMASLPAEQRLFLQKSAEAFSRPWFRCLADRFDGTLFKRWIVQSSASREILAALSVTTQDFQQFHLEALIHPHWADGVAALIGLGVNHALKSTRKPYIRISAYEFQKEQRNFLDGHGFQWESVAEVLVKDYWRPIEDKPLKLATPILLLNRGKTSPACFWPLQRD